VALKLIEIAALREARGTEPALLLDDVFAELDRERQTRLALRLLGPKERQVFVTSPRADELPPNLELPVWLVEDGRVSSRE
jgi:DNA replication and repair protein RecF